MRHVHHKIRANFFGNFRKTLKVNAQCECRCARNDEFGFGFARECFHRVIIDVLVGIQTIRDHIEPFARLVEFHAVGQMTAFSQTHAHNGVPRLQDCEKYALIGLRA